MNRLLTLIVALSVCTALLAGCLLPAGRGAGNGQTTTDNTPADFDYVTEVSKDNISDLVSETAGKCNILLSEYASKADGFAPSGYEVRDAQFTEDDQSNQAINIYWHETGCDKCSETDCTVFRAHLFYVAGGVDAASATLGYEPYNSDKVFSKKINNGKTAVVILVNGDAFIRFVINDECSDFDKVIEDFIFKMS